MQKRLHGGSVDVIVTSPNYNLGIDYGTCNDKQPRETYLDWMVDVASEMHRVLKDTGSLFLNLGSKPKDPWVCYDVLNVFRGSFTLQNTFHWVKSLTVTDKLGKSKSHGHFKPLNSDRFVNDCHEFVFHLTKHGQTKLDRLALGVPHEDQSNVKRWKSGKKLRCRGNVWQIGYETITQRSKDRPHPATFPVQLAKNCLLVHGLDRIDLALDPFNGIGSSALAAKELGVNFIGFDIDKDYHEEALRRLEDSDV
jgi:site-specific DNA-methyltransferase (adenine-specific)